jgi:hypothetical protein
MSATACAGQGSATSGPRRDTPDPARGQEPAALGTGAFQKNLGVQPTPDNGVRLSAERLWDEAQRPHGPAPAPDVQYSAPGQALARDLVAVHDHLRGELAQLRDMIAQVAQGSLDPGAARSEISKLTMRQNQWTVGAYCESYCRLVGTHHTIEDQALFPGLRSLDGHG